MTQYWERILYLLILQHTCQNIHVTRSKRCLPGSSEETGLLGLVHEQEPIWSHHLLHIRYMCSCPLEQFIIDTFGNPTNFLVLPAKDLCYMVFPAPAVPSCFLHNIVGPEVQLWVDQETQVAHVLVYENQTVNQDRRKKRICHFFHAQRSRKPEHPLWLISIMQSEGIVKDFYCGVVIRLK